MNHSQSSVHSCPTFVTDKQLKIINKNELWEKTFLERDHLEDLVSDPSQFDQFISLLKTGNVTCPIQFELGLKSLTQEILPYVWTIIPEDNLYKFYGFYVEPRKEIETRYERMYHTTTDAVMLLSSESFMDCNEATLKIFKLNTVRDFVKCHPADLSPEFQPDGEASLPKANRMIEKALKEGRNFFEWVHRDSEGRNFPCEVLLNRIEIDGKIFIQASVRDISERIMMQKEIDETRVSQLNAARLASLGEMAGGIAHEINNPMAIIRGQAEYLQKFIKNLEQDKSIQLEKGLNKILQTVDRITKIIKGLRAVSRDSTQDPMIEQDLLEIVNDTMTLFEEKFRFANIRYELDTDSSVMEISCRPAEISQVVLNLMNNSYDAIIASKNPWIKISISKLPQKVIMTFSDSGTGIPEKVASKIFEPFYTTKEVGKGTGLGLSISKSIVERHGGEFILDQTAKNTTFKVILPCK